MNEAAIALGALIITMVVPLLKWVAAIDRRTTRIETYLEKMCREQGR